MHYNKDTTFDAPYILLYAKISKMGFIVSSRHKDILRSQISFLYGIAAALLIIFMGCSPDHKEQRPQDSLILDQASILGDISESLEIQLQSIRDMHGIEIVMATVESTGQTDTIESLAAKLFSQWEVGRNYEGRGLLLLLAKEEKKVRLEVGFALEGTFTDLFSGYIEDKQLRSYFLSDQLATGLTALVEEIEIRASLFTSGELSAEKIHTRDMKFLSAGGGAGVSLENYQPSEVVSANSRYSAGKTPEQAWQTLLQSWRDKNRDPDIGVYTPVTRLIYRAFTNAPDRRFEEDILTWADKPYEVIKNQDFAVIFFGREKGWENAPFLFCRTEEGWQFDMVHQRKIVRMGKSPYWGIERNENPYIHLLSGCPRWMGQDIPLDADATYDVQNDKTTAQSIVKLEQQLNNSGEKFDTLLQLGRLYTLTSMGQQRFTLLNKAHQQKPDEPTVLKFLAIAHVDAHYQYTTALRFIDQYVELLPSDKFGHFYRGYILMMLKRWDDAIASLQAGLAVDPKNIYGLCKLARTYHLRNSGQDRADAKKILLQLKNLYPDHIRTQWLHRFLTD